MPNRLGADDRFATEMAPPAAERLGELARDGFRSVVNLRAPGEADEILSPTGEGEPARRLGLAYLNIPVPPESGNEATARRFGQEVARLPGAVAVHCASGHSAGHSNFMHIARGEGLSGNAAVAKAESMGFQFGAPEAKAFFRRYADSGRPGQGGAP